MSNSLPTIEDDRLALLVSDIVPVHLDGDGTTARVYAACDPRRTAFSWDAPTSRVVQVLERIGEPVETLHTFGAPAFFKPTLAEVFAQMPDGIEDRANAFSIDLTPEQFKRVDPTPEVPYSSETYHAATVQFLRVGA